MFATEILDPGAVVKVCIKEASCTRGFDLTMDRSEGIRESFASTGYGQT